MNVDKSKIRITIFPKSDGEKWSRKIILKLPHTEFCQKLQIHYHKITFLPHRGISKKGRNWDFFENLRNNQLIMHQK